MAKSSKPRKPYRPKTDKDLSHFSTGTTEDPLKNIWGDVSDISKSITETLTSTVEVIKVSCDPLIEKSATAEEIASIKAGVKTITNDMSSVVARKRELNEIHKDRTGKSVDPDDHALALNVFDQYVQLMDLVETVVMPNVNEVMALTNEIINRHTGGDEHAATTEEPACGLTDGIRTEDDGSGS